MLNWGYLVLHRLILCWLLMTHSTRALAHRPNRRLFFAWLSLCAGLSWIDASMVLAARGELELTVNDSQTRELTAVRMDLQDARGRSVRVPGLTRVGGQVVFDGRTVLELRTGHYTFRMEKGPEFRVREGHFQIDRGAGDNHAVEMQRFVDMAAEGWWSGDLQMHSSPRHAPVQVRAEDLRLAPLITTSNLRHKGAVSRTAGGTANAVGYDRCLTLGGVQLVTAGSEVLLFGAADGPDLMPDAPDSVVPWAFVRRVREAEAVHFHLGACVDWDLPVWVACERPDSVGVLHAGIGPAGSADPPTGRPRDTTLFPEPLGTGRWAQAVYYRLLEAGYRLPPAAGSGAGVQPNPPGCNRVYVHCGAEFSERTWWDGLRAGRVLITNGPLLRVLVNGQLPGHVFTASRADELELTVDVKLGTREKIRYLEIIRNGRPVHQVRLADWAAGGGRLPSVVFRESGWLVIRAVTDNSHTYQMASTGPFYVEFDGRPRISRQAAQFFRDWIQQRARQIRDDQPQRWAQILPVYREARDAWQQRVTEATVD